MNVHVVFRSDGDYHNSIEAIFTKKKDAEDYVHLLGMVSRGNDFHIDAVPLDAEHTMPGVIGFCAHVRDGDPPYVTGPIIIGREELEKPGRYNDGALKGIRHGSAEATTHTEAVAQATAARDAVGKPAAKRRVKKKGAVDHGSAGSQE